MYSIGRADENPIARIFGKSGAGLVRWKTSVNAFFATTPDTLWPFTYAAIAGAVPFTYANPSQYFCMPTIVLS